MNKILFVAIALFACSTSSLADTKDPTDWDNPPVPTLIGPGPDADGTYTISWSSANWNRPVQTWTYQLQEQRGEGAWQTVYNNSVFSTTLSGRSAADYRYRVRGCNNSDWCGGFSDTVMVIVQTGNWPVPDTLDDQLAYEFATRIGDINSDGRFDILIDRITPAESRNGGLETYILQQLNDGSFTAYSPSNSQLSQAINWPVTPLDLLLDDFNADGFADVVIRKLSNTISGAIDQIVFAPAQVLNTTPRGIRSFDRDLIDFSNDYVSWNIDDGFFDAHALVTRSDGHWKLKYRCRGGFRWPQGWSRFCWYEWVWVRGRLSTTYPGVSERAIDVWKAIKRIRAGNGAVQDVVDILQEVLGVDIGGSTFCFDAGVTDNDDCVNIEFDIALFSVADAAENENTASSREAGVVYLTAHRLWMGFKHSAIEFTDPAAPLDTETVSAGPDTWGGDNNAKLESKENRRTDLPILNFPLGTITSAFVGVTPTQYFEQIKDGNAKYLDCLKYSAVPSEGLGYNSNSFTAGLVIATNGLSSYPTITLIGGETPVPSVYFTSASPPCP